MVKKLLLPMSRSCLATNLSSNNQQPPFWRSLSFLVSYIPCLPPLRPPSLPNATEGFFCSGPPEHYEPGEQGDSRFNFTHPKQSKRSSRD